MNLWTPLPSGAHKRASESHADRPPDPDAEEDPLSASQVLARPGGPTRLLHYVLLNEIGQGGMGVVYSAYDEKLDRRVALKILRKNVGEEAQRRLVREAQALARISHPNVVQIHEIGEHRELTFIVMAFIDGRTLRSWLVDEQPCHALIVEKFIAAGRGLAAAHARGVVHRDFKSDNVLVGDEGVWVVDFGLAREGADAPVDPPSASHIGNVCELSSDLTKTGSLLGTPAYMAPEQYKGQPTDGLSDQYSFCVSLWEALYGERPFPTDDFETLSTAVLNGQVREPARSEVPSWLRKILDRGMQVDRTKRWPSMDALLDALSRDISKRRRIMVAVGVVLVLAALVFVAKQVRDAQAEAAKVAACERDGQAIRADWNEDVATTIRASFERTGLGVATSAWSRSRATLDAYADAWSRLRTEACLEPELEQTGVSRERERVLSCLDERRAGLAGLVSAWADADEQTVLGAPTAAARLAPPSSCVDAHWLNQRLIAPPELAAEVQAIRTRLERVVALELALKLDDAHREATAALVGAVALAWRPLVAEARLQLGIVEARLGQHERASETLVVATYEATESGNDLVNLDATTALVEVLGVSMSMPARANYWTTLAERWIARLGLAGSTREATLLDNRGAVLAAGDAHAEALELHRRALVIREAELGTEHPLVAQSLTNIGRALAALGERDEALVAHRRARQIYAHTLGEEHPAVARALTEVADILVTQHEFGDALTTYRRALGVAEAALGSEHEDLGPALLGIGLAHEGLEQLPEAATALERALELYERDGAPAPETPAARTVAEIRFALGRVEWARGKARRGRARALVEAALAAQAHGDGEREAIESWLASHG